jgi:hypothetical protein
MTSIHLFAVIGLASFTVIGCATQDPEADLTGEAASDLCSSGDSCSTPSLKLGNGLCLDSGGGHAGDQPYMAACANPLSSRPAEIWSWEPVGTAGWAHLVSYAAGLHMCVDANTGAAGRVVYLRQCDSGSNLNLLWRRQATGVGATFELVNHVQSTCLLSGSAGSPATPQFCANNQFERWF